MPSAACARTLLLNAGYEPLRVLSWQRAFGLLLKGRVEVIEVFPEFIRTPSRLFPVPAVVRLLSYVRHRPPPARFSRRNVLARDGHRCQYCGAMPERARLTLDHVVPRSRGGRSCWENVVTCCHTCNHLKGSRCPEEAGLRLRAAPKRPTMLGSSEIGLEPSPELWRPYLANGWMPS
jgi:5-methylcytosine-specific restriction endonuclease McrA